MSDPFRCDVVFQKLAMIHIRNHPVGRKIFGWELRRGQSCPVDFLVDLQVRPLVETSHATWEGTDVGLLSWMNTSMYLHVEFKAETLPADITFERLLSSVSYWMSFKLVLIMKHHQASGERTSKVPPLMVFHMLLQRDMRREWATILTYIAKVLLIDTSVSWAALAIPLTLLLLFLLLPHRERFCFILDLLCD